MGRARWDSPLWFRVLVWEVYTQKNSYGSTQDMINFTWMVVKIGQSNWYLNCILKVGGWGGCLQIEKSRWRVFWREQVSHVQENEVTNVYAIHCCVTISGNCCKAIQSDMWLPVDVSEWVTFLRLSHPCSVSAIWFYTFSFFMFWILWKWSLLMSRHSCSCNWLVRYLAYVNLSAVFSLFCWEMLLSNRWNYLIWCIMTLFPWRLAS